MSSLFLLESGPVSPSYFIIKLVLIATVFICALLLIYLIMGQSGNSSGIGALGGSSETFLSKNKSKTKESRAKRRTILLAIIIAVALVAYAILGVVPF